MTDAIREQIKRDAEAWADPAMRSAFYAGLEHQHPIAYSQGLSDAIEAIRALIVPTGQYSSATTYAANTAYENAIKELEKLKQ